MKRPLARLAALCLSILPAGAMPAYASAADLHLDAASGFTIAAQINGHPVRLRVDPETPGYIILNPDTVARIGLRPSLLRSRTQVGPVRLSGFSKVARIRIGETDLNRRTVWLDRPVVDDADGLIGPADMPFGRVTFSLRAPQRDESVTVLPLEFERSRGLFFPVTMGEQIVRFHFSILTPHSMATAAAGAHIAALHGGAWTGEPREQHIIYQVVRPARPLALERPVSLNGLGLDGFLVRTGDHRGDLTLPPEPDADPDEIVVTGDGGRRQRARFKVTLGLDRLSQCSSLVWDNGTRRMTFNCSNSASAPAPAERHPR